MSRRADGSLERDVLQVLWRSKQPLTPAEVRSQLADRFAYTTVLTILTRLHDKGLAEREARGRAFAYNATMSEADLAAKAMSRVLADTSDRAAALAGFASTLSRRDAAALRQVLASLTTS